MSLPTGSAWVKPPTALKSENENKKNTDNNKEAETETSSATQKKQKTPAASPAVTATEAPKNNNGKSAASNDNATKKKQKNKKHNKANKKQPEAKAANKQPEKEKDADSNANGTTQDEGEEAVEAALKVLKEQKVSEPDEKGEHPLQTPWSIYFDKRQSKPIPFKEFERGLKKLGTVHSMEELWKHYSWLHRPDDLPKDHNIFMFRHNYTPAWETFPNGGCWIIKVLKRNGLINRMWEELVFAAAGEQFEDPCIVGIALSSRMREDVISVWNRDNHRFPDLKFVIGDKLKAILNLDDTTVAEYKLFNVAVQDGSTFRNAKAYVYAAKDENAHKEHRHHRHHHHSEHHHKGQHKHE